LTKCLEQLLADIRACRICRDCPDGKPLPHEPRPVLQAGGDARILIAGQAPGTRVHASGRPFTDPSGERLRDWLGVDANTFYDISNFAIVPMGFCFPGLTPAGADLPPRRECAPAWRYKLLAAMPRLELVVCLGAHAMHWHMPEHFVGSVDAAVRDWRRCYHLTPRVIPLPHPSWRNNAWLSRNPWFARELLPVLRRDVAELLATPLADAGANG
jgi:uracil-DNA glycosylase